MNRPLLITGIGRRAGLFLARSFLRREGGLEELQHAVDYLLDSRYVTGRILHLDGGRHLKS